MKRYLFPLCLLVAALSVSLASEPASYATQSELTDALCGIGLDF